MPVPNITQLPPAPIRSKYSDEFAQTAEDFVSALPQFSQEMNDAAVFVEDRAAEVDTAQQATAASEAAAEGYRDEAEDYKNAAAATVNFVGKWADLSGSLDAPAVVYHDSIYWNLLNNLEDVTTSEPAVTNSDWLKVYEVAPQNNLTATVDPTVNDDESQGYGPTSRWINNNTGEFWLCISAAAGEANWQPATLTVDELGSAALADTGDFDQSGAAADAVADHEAESDPHSQYAQLSGGADADFTAMPQVGGDPIVESGSNSDGEWTRWADGTQNTVIYVSGTVDVTSPSTLGGFFGSGPTAPQPISFVVSPAVSFSGSISFGDIGAFNNDRSTEVTPRYRAVADATDVDASTTIHSSGRWK